MKKKKKVSAKAIRKKTYKKKPKKTPEENLVDGLMGWGNKEISKYKKEREKDFRFIKLRDANENLFKVFREILYFDIDAQYRIVLLQHAISSYKFKSDEIENSKKEDIIDNFNLKDFNWDKEAKKCN